MFENFTEVIGFYLGDGETALTRLSLDDSDKHSHPDPVEIYKKKNLITAIGYHPTYSILIGESALRSPGITKSYMTFKRRSTRSCFQNPIQSMQLAICTIAR